MNSLLKRIKTNALLTAALYAALGLVLLFRPELSATVLCTALGLILVVCGLIDIAVFLRNRDGSLYAGAHLVIGIILAAVGIWLMSRPTLISVVIPRIIGALICVHGASDLGDAITLRKNGASHWSTALLLGLVTLALGAVLLLNPFETFTTVVRIIGLFLLYDGISDIWIAAQVGKAIRQAEKDSNAARNAVDVEYRDVKDE